MDYIIDVHSGTWKAVKQELDSRLESCINLLQAEQSEVATAALRGRIKEIKSLLGLAEIVVMEWNAADTNVSR